MAFLRTVSTDLLVRAFGGKMFSFYRWLIAFIGSFLVFETIQPVAAQQPSAEYKVKAVFLFNFVQYVEWPTNTFADAESPIVMGVLGLNPFGSALEETVANETVKGRKLVVHYYKHVNDAKNCQVLFISDSEDDNLNSTLNELKRTHVLTVSDIANFSHKGGMINFLTEKNKIRFSINQAVATDSGLTISSKLLQLARKSTNEKN